MNIPRIFSTSKESRKTIGELRKEVKELQHLIIDNTLAVIEDDSSGDYVGNDFHSCLVSLEALYRTDTGELSYKEYAE